MKYQKTLIEFDKLKKSETDGKFYRDIENFAIKHSDKNSRFLRLGVDKDGYFIQARNYVGVLQTKSGATIEILPKITEKSDDISTQKSKEILLKMLKTLKNFPFKSSNLANLDLEKSSLLEIFISMFLSELGLLVKKGIKSDYIKLSDNLKFLKGKLKIGDQITKNSIHKERFFVEFDEFSPDIGINQIIKTTLKFLYKMSSSYKNQQKIREFLFIFDDVKEHKNFKNFFKNHKISRQIKHYEQIILWCKVFLMGNNFTPNRGDELAFALLFDMNRLFESYVGECVKRKIPKTKLQHNGKHLIKEPKSFSLRPDIFIKNKTDGKRCKIVDTKWKIVKSDRDISQDDLYQLYAYGKKYGCDELFLVYPKIDEIPKLKTELKYDETMRLNIIFFDLEDERNLEFMKRLVS